MAAQYAVFGELKLAYESFGTDEYLYEGSLWKTPLDLDAFNDHPEPYAIYLFHMTLGHHGVFSLTPIFLFSAWGADTIARRRRPIRKVAGPRGSRRGGPGLADDRADHRGAGILHLEPQGAELRRLDPGTSLAVLDDSVLAASAPEGGRGGPRRAAGSAAWRCWPWRLSVMSVGYAIRNPWSHPWILDALEHLDLYPLTR